MKPTLYRIMRCLCLCLTMAFIMGFLLSEWFLNSQISHDLYVSSADFFASLVSPKGQLAVVVWTTSMIFFAFFFIGKKEAIVELVFFLIVAIHYACTYSDAVKSTNHVVLMTGIALSCFVRFFLANEDSREIIVLTAGIPLMISICSLLPKDYEAEFLYYGVKRRTGIWTNPNNFGTLMAIATVLILGLVGCVARNLRQRRSRWVLLGLLILFSLPLFYGLVLSLSRGAWLATVIGCFYLGWSFLRVNLAENPKSLERFVIIAVTAIAALISLIWASRSTEIPLLRRLGSIANPYDLSAANRLVAYKEALRVIAMRPLFGHGWNEALRKMDTFSSPSLSSGAAINTNSYLKLAMSTGLPCLLFLLFLIVQSVIPPAGRFNVGQEWANVCRAGIFAGAVAFWFNGGLLTTPVWTVFWVLLGLGQNRVGLDLSESVEK